MTDQQLRNIAFLCTYFTSSTCDWEKAKVGSPIDSYQGTDRFSFHTEEEEGPFIHFTFPAPINVAEITLRVRDKYTPHVLPLILRGEAEDGEFVDLATITEATPAQTFKIDRRLKGVRVEKEGYGHLYFSTIDIFVERDEFEQLVSVIDQSERFILVHAPFYGLGGGLAVCASAIGVAERGKVKKILADRPVSTLLSYPPSFELTPEATQYLSKNLGRAPASAILRQGRLKSKQDISRWTDDGSLDHQDRPVILLTRDNLPQFKNTNETSSGANQRYYKRLIPNDEVLELADKIRSDHALDDAKFETALGLHIRHGNGERYFARNLWGVKPPPLERILKPIQEAVAKSGIDRIVACSDTKAVEDVLKEQFPELDIIFISRSIQDTGAGCNHVDNVFDRSIYRRNVSRNYDDKVSFAELLTLAQCKRLCGGRSYFYYAATGFSDVKEEDIFYIDNNDRYVQLPETYEPIVEIETEDARTICEQLKASGHHLDGLFLNRLNDGALSLTYFDNEIGKGTAQDLCDMAAAGSFKKRLIELRLYA